MVALRAKYLRKLKDLREKEYDIYFLDESYMNAHHTCEKEWQSATQQRAIPLSNYLDSWFFPFSFLRYSK